MLKGTGGWQRSGGLRRPGISWAEKDGELGGQSPSPTRGCLGGEESSKFRPELMFRS